jgi:hypothetical protein
MTKTCLIIILLLTIIIFDGIYKFFFQDTVPESSDGRELIALNTDEKDFVLAEMRLFLSSTQQIIQGIAEDDMELVASQAKKSGKDVQVTAPATLANKLPVQFRQLGSDTHAKFDQIAMDAKDLGDSDHSLSQLAVLLQNCTSCHEAYRF